MNWFKSNNAKNLIEQEKSIVNKYIEDKFGYYALQLGDYFSDFLEQSRISKHIFNHGPLKNIFFDSLNMPFAEDSIDLIICPHFLEQGYNKDIFNELFRVVIPGGNLIIIAFNPYSLAGIKNLFSFNMEFPWSSKFLTMANIQYELKESGFSIVEAKIANYQPIILDSHHSFNTYLESIGNRWLPLFGNIFFIVAQKKVISLTPVKPRWKNSKKRTIFREE
ncbi:class I SAM-dependent methyltransferase [Methylophilaceae bacterium]|jgi:ubiquinone/menaquinone biosynthesis C-methylase UbiE|nr:class I SAM-dependent methyltransferase [Methylophilaceae bacterium]